MQRQRAVTHEHENTHVCEAAVDCACGAEEAMGGDEDGRTDELVEYKVGDERVLCAVERKQRAQWRQLAPKRRDSVHRGERERKIVGRMPPDSAAFLDPSKMRMVRARRLQCPVPDCMARS